MKKWSLWVLAALLTGYFRLWPFPKQDAGELYIVETLLVEEHGEHVLLKSGAVTGSGETLEAALEEMRRRTPGTLFLRQTQRVVFCGGAGGRALELPRELPLGLCVYETGGAAEELDTEELSRILGARERENRNAPTLAQLLNRALEAKP